MIKKAIYLLLIIIGAFSLYQTASAQTLMQTSGFDKAVTDITQFNSGGSFGAPFQISQQLLLDQVNFAPIATGTMTNLVSSFRWAPFGPANFTGNESVFIRLERKNGLANFTALDCVTNNFIPSEIASSGVPVLIDFEFTGTECLIYDGPRSTATTSVPVGDRFEYRALPVPSYSGAIAQTRNIDGERPMLLYGTEGPTDPFILPTPINTIDFLTRFTGATVQGASTTVNFDVSYFLNTPEYTANTRPDLIQVLVGRDGFGQVALARDFILPLTDGNHTKNVPVNYDLPDTKEFIDGDYYAYINFWNLTTDTLAFNKTNVVLTFTIDNGLVINQLVVSLTDGTEISANIQYQDCNLTNIQGCLTNAFIFVFVPETEAFNKFLNLWERVENKPPFGYLVSILDALNGLTDNATPAFSFGDIPFLNQIFTPFRDLLIIGLWVLYALFFMGRLSKLQL